jgi:hypothetical protein
MAFLTIEPAAGLDDVELERAIENGPPEVAMDAPHEQLLASVGFVDIEAVDVTTEFSRTQNAWTEAWSAHEQELLDLLGSEALDERMKDRQAMRTALDEHLLRRTLYLARRADNANSGPT